MTSHDPDTIATAPANAASPGSAPTAGAMLRHAREAAGLSLDAVAQQLKLAPRQVTAIEDDDFARLPGRTFVRGFVRNYARLLRIDPEAALKALAGSDAPALDSPALQPTTQTMGELPTIEPGKSSWTRWAIPSTLIAIIVTAAVYEFSRGGGDLRLPQMLRPEAPTAPAVPAPAPSAGTTDIPLANPMANAPAAARTPASEAPASAAERTASAPSTEAPAADAAYAAAEATVVLSYRKQSWTEIKDGGGRVLFSQITPAGQVRSITGTPPFDLVIGNANDVTLTFRGQPVDLGPYTSKNIARLVLE